LISVYGPKAIVRRSHLIKTVNLIPKVLGAKFDDAIAEM